MTTALSQMERRARRSRGLTPLLTLAVRRLELRLLLMGLRVVLGSLATDSSTRVRDVRESSQSTEDFPGGLGPTDYQQTSLRGRLESEAADGLASNMQ